MTESDAIFVALKTCQKVLGRLSSPHRQAILRAVFLGDELKLQFTGVGVFSGNRGLEASRRETGKAFKTCAKAIKGLSTEARERTYRGMLAWLIVPATDWADPSEDPGPIGMGGGSRATRLHI